MKTLVIHPKDSSTDFLIPIYEKIKDALVIRNTNLELRKINWQILNHDRIIMCGHGCPDGLFGTNGLVISDENISALRNKELIGIWCNADVFFNEHRLDGIFSGMFISEIEEGYAHGVFCDQKTVDESNNTFAKILGASIESFDNIGDQYMNLMENYNTHLKNEVVNYNAKRLYYAESVNGYRMLLMNDDYITI